MQGQRTLFSSMSEEWVTPQGLFDSLNEEFDFEKDLAATSENTKCEEYITKEIDALTVSWGPFANRRNVLWCNPPYGRKVGKFVQKAYETSKLTHPTGKGCTIVMLIPARTDTKWFHDYIYNKPNVEIRFIRGRLRFEGGQYPAPFPSMIVIFRHLITDL